VRLAGSNDKVLAVDLKPWRGAVDFDGWLERVRAAAELRVVGDVLATAINPSSRIRPPRRRFLAGRRLVIV
jgi:hypothetical protein